MDNSSEALLWIAMGVWSLALAVAAVRGGAGRVRIRGWVGLAQAFVGAALLVHAVVVPDVTVGCLAVLWIAVTLRGIRTDATAAQPDSYVSNTSMSGRRGKRPELRVIRGGAGRTSAVRSSARGTHVRPNA